MRKCLLCWAVLVACLVSTCFVSTGAGGISIDGFVQPEEWEKAPFTMLFTSGQESGCAVSYADARAWADVPAGKIYFAFQVVDEAFSGGEGLSRIHIRIDRAEITLTAGGGAQASDPAYTAQAVGRYQAGAYNNDYVLEAEISVPGGLRGEKQPVSVWFTDGRGGQSAVCELTVELGLPESSSNPPASTKEESSAVQQRPGTQERTTAEKPATRESTLAATQAAASGESTTGDKKTPVSRAGIIETATPSKAEKQALAQPEQKAPIPGGSRNTGGYAVPAEDSMATENVREAASPTQAFSIPATGESGAGTWSVKRIAACTVAGACVAAAALLFILQARKKENGEAAAQ